MDNQQERLLLNIGYLLGVIDGEGCYQLPVDYNVQHKPYFSPSIVIVNTDKRIIDRCSETLHMLNIPHHIWSPKTYGSEKLRAFRLTVHGIKRCKRYTDELYQYDHAKHDKLSIIKEFVDYRLSIPERLLKSGHVQTYGDKEIDLKRKLNELNAKGRTGSRIPRDYTPESMYISK